MLRNHAQGVCQFPFDLHGSGLSRLLLPARLAAMEVSGAEEGSWEEAVKPKPMKVTGSWPTLSASLRSRRFSRGIT